MKGGQDLMNRSWAGDNSEKDLRMPARVFAWQREDKSGEQNGLDGQELCSERDRENASACACMTKRKRRGESWKRPWECKPACLRDEEKTMRGEQKRLDRWEMHRRCTGDDSENGRTQAHMFAWQRKWQGENRKRPWDCEPACLRDKEKTTRGERKRLDGQEPDD